MKEVQYRNRNILKIVPSTPLLLLIDKWPESIIIMRVFVGLSYCRAHVAAVITKTFITDKAIEKMISNDATTSLRCLLLGIMVFMSAMGNMAFGSNENRSV